MELQKIRQKLHLQKNRIGLVGGRLNIQEYKDANHNVSASISPNGWNVEISLKEGFSPIQDKRQKAYARIKKIADGLETLVMHITLHEFAHWELPYGSQKGCPYNIYEHDKILEAVKNALPENKKAHADYVANAFEDMIINPGCREYNGDFSGQVLFWDNEGLSCRQEGQEHFTPFYEAFVKLNMHLFGDNADRALLKRHYSNGSTVDNAVKKVISDLSLPENIKDTAGLFNRPRWANLAAMFARDIAGLLEIKPTERLSAFSQKGEGSGKEKQSGNGIEQKAGTKDGKEEISHGRYSNGEKLSTNLTRYEQLDALYRSLARAIPVRVEAMSRHHGLTISPLSYRPFDDEKDDPAKLKLSRLFITDEGLKFAYPSQPLTVDAKSKFQRRSFPDFKMVVLDNSGSMGLAPDNSQNIGNSIFIPWGDNSKYHYALLGFYGIEEFLQQQGIAQYIHHGLSLFSDNTRFKEADYSGMDSVRKLALAPEFGSTFIDVKTLEQALSGRESFVLSLSDGEVANWASEKGKFLDLAKKNYYAHVQIGSSTSFSSDLESDGIPVFYVSTGNDLSKLMVDITKKTYDKFTKK